MTAPSIARLLAAFPHLDKTRAKLIRTLAHAVPWGRRDGIPTHLAVLIERNCPATWRYAQSCHGDPFDGLEWRTTMALHAIDVILETHGIESLGPVDMHNGPPFEYCNAGDPYVSTLIYRRSSERLFIGCWGDVVEREDPKGEW